MAGYLPLVPVCAAFIEPLAHDRRLTATKPECSHDRATIWATGSRRFIMRRNDGGPALFAGFFFFDLSQLLRDAITFRLWPVRTDDNLVRDWFRTAIFSIGHQNIDPFGGFGGSDRFRIRDGTADRPSQCHRDGFREITGHHINLPNARRNRRDVLLRTATRDSH